jgi:hypothetical protein
VSQLPRVAGKKRRGLIRRIDRRHSAASRLQNKKSRRRPADVAQSSDKQFAGHFIRNKRSVKSQTPALTGHTHSAKARSFTCSAASLAACRAAFNGSLRRTDALNMGNELRLDHNTPETRPAIMPRCGFRAKAGPAT